VERRKRQHYERCGRYRVYYGYALAGEHVPNLKQELKLLGNVEVYALQYALQMLVITPLRWTANTAKRRWLL
jgi:hypothetical protein